MAISNRLFDDGMIQAGLREAQSDQQVINEDVTNVVVDYDAPVENGFAYARISITKQYTLTAENADRILRAAIS